MKYKFGQILSSLFATTCILILFELISSALFPSIGMMNFKIPMNILIILFFGFKLQVSYVAVLILFIQIFHGAFSVEGWALGTFIGITLSLVMTYFRDIIHLSSGIATMVITFCFSLMWFILESVVLYFKDISFAKLFSNFGIFIPEALVLALIAPLCFSVLEKIWKVKDSSTISMDL